MKHPPLQAVYLASKRVTMTEPLDLAENWVYEVWQRGNMDYAEQLCAENYTDFTVPDNEEGDCAAFRDAVMDLRNAFPNLKAEILDSFQDQDFIILRILFTGTQHGDYMGIEATQQRVEWQSIDILHYRGDEWLERWSQNDLLTQLGDWKVTGETDFGAMQSESERSQLIVQLAEMPNQARAAIRAQGILPPRPGEWSTQAVVGHLWRTERQVWQARLEQMLREDNPYWQWWDPDRFDWEADFGASDLNVLLDAYEFLRAATCDYLRDLSDEQWARRGTHQTYGELDVMGLMQKAVEHDREHLATLTGAQL